MNGHISAGRGVRRRRCLVAGRGHKHALDKGEAKIAELGKRTWAEGRLYESLCKTSRRGVATIKATGPPVAWHGTSEADTVKDLTPARGFI